MVGVERINLIELDKVRELLDISQTDLESSEILFNHKKYPNAVWDLLQSVEKSTKAEVLMNSLIKFDELKSKIGHNPLPMYEADITDNMKKAEGLKEAINKIPELGKIPAIEKLNLDDYIAKGNFAKQTLNSISKKEKIFSDDINELDGAIEEMNKLINEVKNIDMKAITDEGVKMYQKAYVDNVKAWIELSEKQGIPISEEEKNQNLNITEETIKSIADNLRKNMVLYGITHALNSVLSILIMPHFDFVRYPDKKKPLEYYNENNPLIIKFNKLIEIQKENLGYNKELLEIIERYYKNKIIIEK